MRSQKGSSEATRTVHQLLGARLRKLREARGISGAQAGRVIRASQSKLSRLESGVIAARPQDVADLLDLYGVTCGLQRRYLLGLPTQDGPGWWHEYEKLELWQEVYLARESQAVRICTYDTQTIPALVQIPAYAQAVFRLSRFREPRIDLSPEVLLHRQQHLLGADGPPLWAIVEEAALLRPVGGAEIHLQQLDALIETVQARQLALQIVPLAITAQHYLSQSGPFTMLRSDDDQPDVIYRHPQFGEAPLEVTNRDESPAQALIDIFHFLCVSSSPPQISAYLLADIREKVRQEQDAPRPSRAALPDANILQAR